jgi:uncharacterized protein with HEPN domain
MSERADRDFLSDIQECTRRIHDHSGVNLDIVWQIVAGELPQLVMHIDKILRGLA